jgi:exosortase
LVTTLGVGAVLGLFGLRLLLGLNLFVMGSARNPDFWLPLAGYLLALGGWGVLRHTWFPIAFLLCAIPLPQRVYFQLTFPLRRLASHASAAFLNLLPDVETEVQGVVIDYMHGGRSSSLNVEEACSGMRMMMAFCTLGLAMAYLGDRPLWHRAVMVACCVPIAVLCNTIRVCATGVLHVYGMEDLSQGTAHELLGLAMLPIALGLFALVGFVLRNLFVEEPGDAASPAV